MCPKPYAVPITGRRYGPSCSLVRLGSSLGRACSASFMSPLGHKQMGFEHTTMAEPASHFLFMQLQHFM